MHDGSCTGINYDHKFPKCFRSLHTLLGFSLCTSCQQIKLPMYQFIQFLTCTRIPCRDSHCVNGLVRCCLDTSPSVAVDRRQLYTFQLQQKKRKIVKFARLRFDPKTANNKFPCSIMPLCTLLMCGLSFEFL